MLNIPHSHLLRPELRATNKIGREVYLTVLVSQAKCKQDADSHVIGGPHQVPTASNFAAS